MPCSRYSSKVRGIDRANACPGDILTSALELDGDAAIAADAGAAADAAAEADLFEAAVDRDQPAIDAN